MSEEHIIVRRDGAVLEIQFNRPEKKNAITNAMYGAMADAVTEAENNDDIRAVLFSSSATSSPPATTSRTSPRNRPAPLKARAMSGASLKW